MCLNLNLKFKLLILYDVLIWSVTINLHSKLMQTVIVKSEK